MKLLQERLAYVYAQRPDLEGDRGQMGLAKASGASKAMVNHWLSGHVKSLGLEWALSLEENLGFSHIWLMAGIGEPMAARALTAPLLTLAMPREMELLHLFRRATNEGQGDIFRAANRADKRPAETIRSDES